MVGPGNNGWDLGWAAPAFVALVIGVLIGAVFNRNLMMLPRVVFSRLRALPGRLKIFGRRSASGGMSAGRAQGAVTAVQRELQAADGPPKDGKARDAEGAPEPFSAAKADAALVRRHEFGYLRFRKPPAAYDDLPDNFDNAMSDRYGRLATQFLSSPVAIATDHLNLYDDEEGAVIVRMFRRSDRPIFYAIDRFRRVVGDNARRVIALFFMAAATPLLIGGVFLLWKNAPEWAAVVGLVVTAVAAAIGFLSYTTYRNVRDTGFAEFSGLLERYLAGVSDKFFHANTRMSQVILGEEDDHDALAAKAEKWHKIMLWLGFRTFFIESFLRGAVYQARRNLTYYQLGSLLLLVFLPAGAAGAYFLGAFARAGSFNDVVATPASWFFALAVVVGVAFHAFVRKKDADLALSQADWRGFKALHIEEKMREVIGKYAQEAAIGKRRGVVRPGGGH